MSIKVVFRVQCSGPCKGWLSLPPGYQMGTDLDPADLVTEPTALRAGLWPGGRAAARAARDAGWVIDRNHNAYCPQCKDNPLGIRPPKTCPDCGHVHRGRACGEFHCLCRTVNA